MALMPGWYKPSFQLAFQIIFELHHVLGSHGANWSWIKYQQPIFQSCRDFGSEPMSGVRLCAVADLFWFVGLIHIRSRICSWHDPGYAPIKNFPSRMICSVPASDSSQMLNPSPTTSICVPDRHGAPVCSPYGFPNAM